MHQNIVDEVGGVREVIYVDAIFTKKKGLLFIAQYPLLSFIILLLLLLLLLLFDSKGNAGFSLYICT